MGHELPHIPEGKEGLRLSAEVGPGTFANVISLAVHKGPEEAMMFLAGCLSNHPHAEQFNAEIKRLFSEVSEVDAPKG